MWNLLFVVTLSILLFLKERCLGAFILVFYLSSIISGLIAWLIEPASFLFVFMVFTRIFNKRYPDLYEQSHKLCKKSREDIVTQYPQTQKYMKLVEDYSKELFQSRLIKTLFCFASTYTDRLMGIAKVESLAILGYSLLYRENA